MFADGPFESAQDFLRQMDLGLLDGRLNEAFKSLSRDQLEEVAKALMDRIGTPFEK